MIEWIVERGLTELPDTTLAAAAATRLLAERELPDAEVSVLLTDDCRIHALNRQWRGVDRPTDVLSWPQEDAALLGDVAVSLDTARRQADARGWTIAEEVALLVVHGILHLVGYEDDTEAGAEAMRAVERRLIGKPLDALTDAAGYTP